MLALAAERGSDLLAVRTWHDPDLPLGGWLQPDRTAHWDAAHANARCELDHALERAKVAHPAVHMTPLAVDDDLAPFLPGQWQWPRSRPSKPRRRRSSNA